MTSLVICDKCKGQKKDPKDTSKKCDRCNGLGHYRTLAGHGKK